MKLFPGSIALWVNSVDLVAEPGCCSDCCNCVILGQKTSWYSTPSTYLVGVGRFELPTSWSQTRRPATGPHPECLMRLPCRSEV